MEYLIQMSYVCVIKLLLIGIRNQLNTKNADIN
jgi:hypothetical protein